LVDLDDTHWESEEEEDSIEVVDEQMVNEGSSGNCKARELILN